MANGNIPAAVDAARAAGAGAAPEATAALARAWLAAGDLQAAREALAGMPAADRAPDHARLETLLADAQLSHEIEDRDSAIRALDQAMRLADRERLRLPFVLEGTWIQGALQRDPALADAYRHLLDPGPVSRNGSARSRAGDRARATRGVGRGGARNGDRGPRAAGGDQSLGIAGDEGRSLDGGGRAA